MFKVHLCIFYEHLIFLSLRTTEVHFHTLPMYIYFFTPLGEVE